MAGFWEFPGGKLEAGETPLQALVRECQEEVSLTVLSAEFILEIPDPPRNLYVFRVSNYQGHASKCENQQDLLWVKPQDLSHYEFPPANRLILKWVQEQDLDLISAG